MKKVMISVFIIVITGSAQAQLNNPLRGVVLLTSQVTQLSNCFQTIETAWANYYGSLAFAQASNIFPSGSVFSYIPNSGGNPVDACGLYLVSAASTTAGVISITLNSNASTPTISPMIAGAQYCLTPNTLGYNSGTKTFTTTLGPFVAGQLISPVGITSWTCKYVPSTASGTDLTNMTTMGQANNNVFASVGGAIGGCTYATSFSGSPGCFGN